MRNRFWSFPPPLTIIPAKPSTPADTPGCSCRAFITSASPNIVGVAAIAAWLNFVIPIAETLSLLLALPTFTTSCSVTVFVLVVSAAIVSMGNASAPQTADTDAQHITAAPIRMCFISFS